MIRILTTVTFLLIFAVSFGQQSDTLLFKAYNTKSLPELQSFFDNWALETPGISNGDLFKLNDTAKNIYQIFKSFYHPKDIKKIGRSEWGNDIYKDAKYIFSSRIKYTSQ